MSMPPMERMAVSIGKPCSRPIGRHLRESMHLEAQQREQPSNGRRESVIPPPTTSHRGGASAHEPGVLGRVMITVVWLRGSGGPLPGRPARDFHTGHRPCTG
uniref:Uncharacterized protein n=1 Tax=Zea mays TaxID=4577 RepID=C0PL73_MAIZE|nr:unknown [Zea mays]